MFIFEILLMPLLLSSQVLAELPAQGGDSLGPSAGAGVENLPIVPTGEPPVDEDAEDEPLSEEETFATTQEATETVTGYPTATAKPPKSTGVFESNAKKVETSYFSGLVLLTGLFWF